MPGLILSRNNTEVFPRPSTGKILTPRLPIVNINELVLMRPTISLNFGIGGERIGVLIQHRFISLCFSRV